MNCRLVVFSLCLSSAVQAAEADFSTGAFRLGLRYGVTQLSVSTPQGEVPGFFDDASRQPISPGLSLGYNILGHVTLAADLSGAGWNLQENNRGGGGMLVGSLSWHPLQLFWLNERRPLPFDLEFGFGMGYGIFGQERKLSALGFTLDNSFSADARVYQGSVLAHYYFGRAIGLGLYARGAVLDWQKLYTGFTVDMDPSISGQVWTFGANLEFRFES